MYLEKKQLLRIVMITVLCNSLVWYDYCLYGEIIEIINTLFFPSASRTMQFFASFGTFAVGFLMRPLGAIVLGHIGDRYGRSLAVMLTLILMFVPVGLVSLLPTYSAIGVWAVVFLILSRLVQGFALGGEVGNALFLIESSPPKYRGFFGSFEVLSAVLGAAMAAIVILICKSMISAEAFLEWGWRIPFAFGSLIGIISMILRLTLSETHTFESVKTKISLPIAVLFKKYKRALVIAIGIDSLEESSMYLSFVFINSYFFAQSGFTELGQQMFHIGFLMLVAAITLLSALLSDFIGRRLVLGAGAVLSLVTAYPIFAMLASGGIVQVIVAKFVIAIILGLSLGPVSITVFESLPTEIAFTGLALSRNISSMLFGGIAPTTVLLLIKLTGSDIAGCIPLMATGVITLLSLLFYKPVKK